MAAVFLGYSKKEKAMLGSANQEGGQKLDDGFKRGKQQIFSNTPVIILPVGEHVIVYVIPHVSSF